MDAVSVHRAGSGDEPGDLTAYPGIAAAGGYRAHDKANGPWWYGSAGSGRFDLTRPNGTCYVASTIEAALRERLGDGLVRGEIVDDALWASTAIARMEPDHRPRNGEPLADSCATAAADFHDAELWTQRPYTVPQRWAEAFNGAGFSGVRYHPRKSTGADTFAEAWFAPAGEPSPKLLRRAVPESEWRSTFTVRPAVVDVRRARLI